MLDQPFIIGILAGCLALPIGPLYNWCTSLRLKGRLPGHCHPWLLVEIIRVTLQNIDYVNGPARHNGNPQTHHLALVVWRNCTNSSGDSQPG